MHAIYVVWAIVAARNAHRRSLMAPTPWAVVAAFLLGPIVMLVGAQVTGPLGAAVFVVGIALAVGGFIVGQLVLGRTVSSSGGQGRIFLAWLIIDYGTAVYGSFIVRYTDTRAQVIAYGIVQIGFVLIGAALAWTAMTRLDRVVSRVPPSDQRRQRRRAVEPWRRLRAGRGHGPGGSVVGIGSGDRIRPGVGSLVTVRHAAGRRTLDFVPELIEHGQVAGREIDVALAASCLDVFESAAELRDRGAERDLGIDLQVAGDVDDREQQVAQLVGGRIPVAAARGRDDLVGFLGDLGQRARRRRASRSRCRAAFFWALYAYDSDGSDDGMPSKMLVRDPSRRA